MSSNFIEQLEKLPDYLANHLMITVIALGAGIGVSLPSAVILTKLKALRWPTVTSAGVIQTIPSLALLALMVPLLGGAYGFWPAVVGLTLYSILPILRNTVTGILGVDPAMTEAARGVGMTPGQVLWQVELPLAAPVIIAGIRTATVWVVGIATLATPVGQTCLGNYIFSGLQTRNWVAVLFGCVAAAVLAILLDLMFAGLEKGVDRRSRPLTLTALISLIVVVGAGLVAPAAVSALEADALQQIVRDDDRAEDDTRVLPGRDRPIRIGSKTFTEQYILAALLAHRLEDAGFQVERVESLGSTVGFDALVGGEIDVFVDYTGTIWSNYMNKEEAASAWFVLDAMAGWIATEHDARCLGPLGFENAYALAMRADRAEQLGVESINDLAGHAPDMKMGSDYEFFDRPEWYKLRDTYGLEFDELVNFDSSFMYGAVADRKVDVITAFSSDGRIEAFDLKILEDPRNAFPPYDAVVLLSPQAASYPRIAETLRPLIGAIDVRLMRQANLQVDREEDKLTPEQAARWLAEQIEPD